MKQIGDHEYDIQIVGFVVGGVNSDGIANSTKPWLFWWNFNRTAPGGELSGS